MGLQPRRLRVAGGARGRLLPHRRLLLAPRGEQRVHGQVGVGIGARPLHPLRRSLHPTERLGPTVLQAREADTHRALRRGGRDSDGAVRLPEARSAYFMQKKTVMNAGFGLESRA
jgi:hypothetical protein